jgi:predicted RNase H-like nuclease (RuvC/YqgF family)
MKQRDIDVLKRELVEAKQEIQHLRIRLKNAEILYKLELEKATLAKAHVKRSQRN